MSLKYRAEIDGLRAIAVLSVVLFHARVPGLDGGYVGVDVFFVISGFLITSIISKEITQGDFSFVRFYERRIRRLIPALIPVLLFAIIFTTIFYDADTYLDFSQSVLAFVSLGSNWLFLSEAGYFDTLADAKPLLHTWSLSIEEQYYIVFPSLLVFTFAISRRLSIWMVAMVFMASFLLSVFWVQSGQLDTAYYNSFGRIWELMLGSILALLSPMLKINSYISEILRAFGLTLIVIAVFTFNAETPFPGIMGLLPVVGTAAIIAAKAPVGAIRRVLALAPFVYIGRVSYSFYLWHWVIISFMLVLWPLAGYQELLWGVAASLLLSILSYRFVETPSRKRSIFPKTQHMYALFAGFVVVFMGISSVGVFTGGLPERVSFFGGETKAELLQQIRMAKRERQAAIRTGKCNFAKVPLEEFLSGSDSCYQLSEVLPNILVIGDSHAADLYVALSHNYTDINFIQVTGAGCGIEGLASPVAGDGRSLNKREQACQQFFSRVLNSDLLRQANGVFFTSRYSKGTFTRQSAANLVDVIRQGNPLMPIAVFGPIREFSPSIPNLIKSTSGSVLAANDINTFAQQNIIRSSAVDISEFEEELDKLRVQFVDKNQFICPNNVCTFYTDSGYPVFPDYGHWTVQGAELIGSRIVDRFPNILDIFKE